MHIFCVRFYSKLHRRWLSGRKGAGLQRVLSLLLTLAWAGDCQEVVSHLLYSLQLLSLRPPGQCLC